MTNKQVGDKLVELGYDKKQVAVYASYLDKLANEKDKDNQIKNPWFRYFKPEEKIAIYEKVSQTGVWIDGETVTLIYRKGVSVNYDYSAYKNRVLASYPETQFDPQIVYEGDEFSFEKKNGRVIYTHKMKNPFKNDKKMIGAYCVIKNNRGEFVTQLTPADVAKMRSAAKSDFIWKAWEDQMWLKSVIKRACKLHFKDITGAMDKIDNEENYDLEKLVKEETPVKTDRRKLQERLITRLRELHEIDPDTAETVRAILEEKREAKELTEGIMQNQLDYVEQLLSAPKKSK